MYESLALPRVDWERADQLWLHHYGEQPAILVEGAHDALIGMSSRGYRLGVVTSGTGKRVKREMKELGIEALFEAVVCNEHIVNKKPHPEGLEIAMAKMNVIPDDCCYVGDTPEDIQMGRNAGIFTIGVPSAYPSNKLLRDANPDMYVASTRDLLLHFSGPA
jgi:HAD superfamily hydrolase (TIGR01662 family)